MSVTRRFLDARSRLGRLPWRRVSLRVLVCAAIVAATLVAGAIRYLYFDRSNLPDLEAFSRFELPTVGHVYDVNGRPFMEMASEYREITTYADVPPIVRGAILAAEDKNFFSHNGIDYFGFVRVVCKLKVLNLLGRLTKMGKRDAANRAAIFPQGGSTITQQLVRGYFLKTMTAQENGGPLRHQQGVARALSSRGRRANRQHAVPEAGGDPALVVDRRRDAGEIRFEASRQGRNPGPIRQPDLHGERPVRVREGGGILFWPAARHVHRRRCGKAALLAGTAKSALHYAPNASPTQKVFAAQESDTGAHGGARFHFSGPGQGSQPAPD